MRLMGLEAIYQAPRTSDPHPHHRIYPYLLRKLEITRPNHVWCADITYIPVQRGFLYLVAIMDWATRKVLAWRASNTLHAVRTACLFDEKSARCVLVQPHASAFRQRRNDNEETTPVPCTQENSLARRTRLPSDRGRSPGEEESGYANGCE